jgi:PAS domain S-box-containing protein
MTLFTWLALGLGAGAGGLVLAAQLRRQSRGRRRVEERFQQLAHAVPQIVFLADRRGQVQFLSYRWVEVTGIRRREASGEGWLQAVHPEDRAPMVETMRERVRKGEEFELEHRLRTHDGSYRWQLLRAVPLDEDGRAAASWLGTATDIDDLKTAQERGRQHAEWLRMAGRLTRTGSWRADLATERITLSEEAAAALDLPPQGEVTLQEMAKLVAPESLAGTQQAWTACVERGEPFDMEVGMVTPAGRQVWIRTVGEPVRGEDGTVVAIQGAQQDITPRMQMMEEIRRLNATLEERIAERTAQLVTNEAALRLANTQLESFSYSVSHDLQSPLQRVGSYARLLQQELAQWPQGRAHHYLARIQANADTMSQLIEGLLALAHVSKVEMIRTPVSVSDMAAEILQRLQAEHPQRSVSCQVEAGLSVLGDARLMRSVMENLLANAWKFTANTPEARIAVGASERGEYFVRDNGCGFDMAYADRLFGTFQRLHGADEYPGTGIGLATVARAITRQGGRVWAQAVPGEGATFWFTLPPACAAPPNP